MSADPAESATDGDARRGSPDLDAVLGTEPSRTLVALDFDGTLAPIVARPEDAAAHPDAADVLAALAEAGYRIAILTGRPVADVLRLGAGFGDVRGLTILGHYGMERWADGAVTAPPEHPGVSPARAALETLAATEPGVHVENKGHAVALHTRPAPDPAEAFRRLVPAAESIASELGLEAVPGRFVIELRPPGTDKGGALRELVTTPVVSAVVFAGDDLGDLPAVRTLRELDVRSVVICSDSPETPDELRRQADIVVDGPSGVLAALRKLVS
ncbi:MAG TPA: trehalose-phosphatase [Jiangellaceae bacterium]